MIRETDLSYQVFLKYSLWGNCYQGVVRNKGKKSIDGTRVKTYYYGCGGYITKGTKICQMNFMPKEELEQKVINAILDFYRPSLQKDGRIKLAEIIKRQE